MDGNTYIETLPAASTTNSFLALWRGPSLYEFVPIHLFLDTWQKFYCAIVCFFNILASRDKSFHDLWYASPPSKKSQSRFYCLSSWIRLEGIVDNLSFEYRRYRKYNAPVGDVFSSFAKNDLESKLYIHLALHPLIVENVHESPCIKKWGDHLSFSENIFNWSHNCHG